VLMRSEPEYFVIGDLCARFACSRMWISRHIADHNFPAPIKFGDRVGARRRWRRADVLAWEAKWREPLL
jgi:predicted DNA-binding transcriptional regulator AlpA